MTRYRKWIDGVSVFALIASVLLATVLPTTMSVAVAQDGGEDEAIIARLLGATTFPAAGAYRQVSTDTLDLGLELSLAGFGFSVVDSATYETTITAIADAETGDWNAQLLVNGKVSTQESSLGASDITDGSFTAEFRVVDGALYLNVTESFSTDSDADPLPTGWVLIEPDVAALDDVAGTLERRFEGTLLQNYPFSYIATFATPASTARSDASMFGDVFGETMTGMQLQELLETALNLSVTPQTLPDGRDVDVITFALDFAALMALGADSTDLGFDLPLDGTDQTTLEALLEGFEFRLSVALDDQDRIAATGYTLALNVDSDDIGDLFGEAPQGLEGASSSLVLNATLDVQTVLDAADDAAPVAAPAD